MVQNQEGIGAAFGRVWKALASLLTTGSIHAEEAADSLRDADVVLHQIDEEIELKAQKTLEVADEAMTQYNVLKMRVERQKAKVAYLEKQSERVQKEAQAKPEGSLERRKLDEVTKKYITEQVKEEAVLKPMEDALAEAEPLYQEAKKAVEEAGFSKETAESQQQVLSVKAASAETKKKLAAAFDRGDDSKLKNLFDEAQGMVDQAVASAKAGEEIRAAQPMTIEEADYEFSKATRDQTVEDRFAALKAKTQQQPVEAAK